MDVKRIILFSKELNRDTDFNMVFSVLIIFFNSIGYVLFQR